MNQTEANDASRISNVIRAARKALQMTQIDLAKRLDIKQGTLSKIESGELILSSTQWFQFCEITHLEPHESFLTGFIDPIGEDNQKFYEQADGFRIKPIWKEDAHSKIRAIRPFTEFFISCVGEFGFRKYCKQKKVDPDVFYIYNQQLSLKFTMQMMNDLIHMGHLKMGDEDKIAKAANKTQTHGFLSKQYEKIDSPKEKIQTLIKNASLYEKNYKYKIEDESDSKLVFSVRPQKHIKKFRLGDLELFVDRYHGSYFKNFLHKQQNQFQFKTLESYSSGADQTVYELKLN